MTEPHIVIRRCHSTLRPLWDVTDHSDSAPQILMVGPLGECLAAYPYAKIEDDTPPCDTD